MELKSTRASNLIPFAEVPRNFYGGRPRANRYVSVGSIFDLCCWTLSDAPPLLIVREIQTFVEDLDAQGVGAPSVQLRGATPRNAETLGRERAPPLPPPTPGHVSGRKKINIPISSGCFRAKMLIGGSHMRSLGRNLLVEKWHT